MGKAIFYLLVLALLGAAGLWGYSYVLRPDPQPITQTIDVDVD